MVKTEPEPEPAQVKQEPYPPYNNMYPPAQPPADQNNYYNYNYNNSGDPYNNYGNNYYNYNQGNYYQYDQQYQQYGQSKFVTFIITCLTFTMLFIFLNFYKMWSKFPL